MAADIGFDNDGRDWLDQWVSGWLQNLLCYCIKYYISLFLSTSVFLSTSKLVNSLLPLTQFSVKISSKICGLIRHISFRVYRDAWWRRVTLPNIILIFQTVAELQWDLSRSCYNAVDHKFWTYIVMEWITCASIRCNCLFSMPLLFQLF